MTFEIYEKCVTRWIAEWSKRDARNLSPNTCINCGRFTGLGVDGQDADELFAYLHHESGVPFRDFPFDDYFGPELSVAAALIFPRESIRALRKRRLLIADVAHFMFERLSVRDNNISQS